MGRRKQGRQKQGRLERLERLVQKHMRCTRCFYHADPVNDLSFTPKKRKQYKRECTFYQREIWNEKCKQGLQDYMEKKYGSLEDPSRPKVVNRRIPSLEEMRCRHTEYWQQQKAIQIAIKEQKRLHVVVLDQLRLYHQQAILHALLQQQAAVHIAGQHSRIRGG